MTFKRSMRPILTVGLAILLSVAMFGGCATSNGAQTPVTEPSVPAVSVPTEEPTQGGDHKQELSYYIEEVYSQQIERYYTPLRELWDAGKYLDNGLSLLPSYYCTGNPLDNVGYGLVDLDGDGSLELVIGAILNADKDPSVFEIWTLVNGEPVMLVQSGSDNRHMLQHVEEEGKWYVVNEVSINIASHATYYLKLEAGELKLQQGVVFDAFVSEENPWFLTKDLDWDVSNDTPIDEETANAILDSNRALYTAPDYFTYTSYQAENTQLPQTTPQQHLYERAEALSQRFGLEIRIPEQSELSYTGCDAYAMTDLLAIRSALDVLEESLSLYPEGYFCHLVYGPIESVRLELVGSFTVQEGSDLDPTLMDAFAYNKDGQYLIVVNGPFMDSRVLFREFSRLVDVSYQSGNTQRPQKTPEQLLYERAEALSQRFGLEIRIPEQSELVYTSYDAYALTDLIATRSALDVLEETLSLYPEGFFRQLIYGSIKTVRIELVGGLVVKEGSGIDPTSTNAFAQNRGDHHLVVLNGFFINSRMIFHELSHVIDTRLQWDSLNREGALFSEDAWLALQPEGFRYTMSYLDIPAELQHFIESGDFLSLYSMTFPTEDRAELLSAAMLNTYDAFEAGSGRRAKLQFYAACIRDCFNTEGWPETTLWELVLK